MSPTIRVVAHVDVPETPNFLRTDTGTLPIEAITEAGLREIGKQWTDALVRKARDRRKAARAPNPNSIPTEPS